MVGAWITTFFLVGLTCSTQTGNWTDIDRILSISGVPSAASDGRIYVCTEKYLLCYNEDMSLNWSALLRTGTCQRHVAPITDSAGRVYLAVQNYVQIVTPKPYSYSSKKYTVSFLYNISNMPVFKPIMGLAAAQTDAAIMFYVNAGLEGLYAVTVDGIPRWSLGGKINSSNWVETSFKSTDFCSNNSSDCYFHFSPAVDMCDGSIYISHSDGWLYAIAGWQPFIRWRYNFGLTKDASHVGVTAGNNGLVYAAVIMQEMIYAFDAQTGDVFWRAKVGPMSLLTCFPRVDLTGWVFIGSVDGCVYAISPNGQEVKKYLELESTKSIIQTPPYLECNGGALYVAHIQVTSKYVSSGIKTLVSYTDALSISVFQLDPFTGVLYRRETFLPGLSLEGGCTFDSSLILALVAARISTSGACKSGERSTSSTCVGNLAVPKLPDMNNKNFEEYYISIPSIFLGLVIAAVCIFIWWSRRERMERKKLRDARRKDLGVPNDKIKLAKRRQALEKEATDVRNRYLEYPSRETEDRLLEVLSQLSFVDMLIADQPHVNPSHQGLRRRLEANQLSMQPLQSPKSYILEDKIPAQELIHDDTASIRRNEVDSISFSEPNVI